MPKYKSFRNRLLSRKLLIKQKRSIMHKSDNHKSGTLGIRKLILIIIPIVSLIGGSLYYFYEYKLHYQTSERQKAKTTQMLMDNSWDLHREVLKIIDDYNKHNLNSNEEEKNDDLVKLEEKMQEIFKFYFGLEACLAAKLCDERMVMELFCDIAIREAKVILQLHIDFSKENDDMIFRKKDGTLTNVDIAIYSFANKCIKCKDILQSNLTPEEMLHEAVNFRDHIGN